MSSKICRDNHIHDTSLCLLFLTIMHLLMSNCSWSVLYLPCGRNSCCSLSWLMAGDSQLWFSCIVTGYFMHPIHIANQKASERKERERKIDNWLFLNIWFWNVQLMNDFGRVRYWRFWLWHLEISQNYLFKIFSMDIYNVLHYYTGVSGQIVTFMFL